ncbi:sulfurtransferase [Neobacillus jeddahensis]|uniref:sulfurtransferase n=1 Tax=Neobacillus jeddahensis TaxID=1461580 RepID=UPI00058BFF41|nr:sulfurtransferase [Neobacillus jeddahensis]
MKYVKDKEWLLKNLYDVNVRIVDCRFSLAEPQKGENEYKRDHLPGAVFFDLEQDLSGMVKKHSGRHPLPKVEDLVLKLEQAGISNNTIVIAYDNGEGAYAARFWWLLRYLGHVNVYVLDGGYSRWQKGKLPVSANIPTFDKGVFQVDLKPELMVTMVEVREAIEKNSKILIDSREEKRYQGLEEPIDKIAGHIPNAINKPWMEGVRDNQYLPLEEQSKRFSEIDKKSPIIVYCGSGVTAVPNFLALLETGFENVQLYVGSFSDWISYPENNVE